MKILITSFILILTFSLHIFAQPPMEWLEYYGDEETGLCDIYVCENGDYISVGGSDNIRLNSQFVYVVRTEPTGQVKWDDEFDLFQDCDRERSMTVVEADNGDIVIGGGAQDNQGVSWFICGRLDSEGNLIWVNKYLPQGYCFAIIETKGDAFLLGGRSNNFQSLLMIDGNGQEIWHQEYRCEGEGDLFERISSIREIPEGEFLCLGRFGGRSSLMKVDSNGEINWRRFYDYRDRTISLKEMSTVGQQYYLGGNSDRDGIPELALLLVNREGQIIWDRFYNFNNEISCISLTRTFDNGAIFTGQVQHGFSNFGFAFKVDHVGDSTWFHRADRVLLLASVVIDQDNFPIACGAIYQPAFLYKIRPDVSAPIFIWTSHTPGSLELLTSDSVQITVRAIDYQNDPLNYYWIFNGDTLSSRPETDSIFAFSINNDGDYDLNCFVWDATQYDSVTWHVTVTDLFVSAFTPDTLDLAIRRGTSVDFSLDTICYTDGAEPEILWTKTNLSNGQAEETGSDAGATIDFPWSGEYSVEGRVTRGESSDAVTWHVLVKGAIWAFVPVGDSLEVLPDSVVHFEVVPGAPEDESLEVQWLVDGELVREGELALDWAFSTVDNCRRYLVQCVVADSVEADTVKWVVTVNDLNVGSEIEVGNPGRVALLSVSPNPFNSTLTIRYATGGLETAATRLGIYDIAGREVAKLLGSTGVSAGQEFHPATEGGATEHQIVWDASGAPAGVYFVRLQAGSKVSTKKVVLMR